MSACVDVLGVFCSWIRECECVNVLVCAGECVGGQYVWVERLSSQLHTDRRAESQLL